MEFVARASGNKFESILLTDSRDVIFRLRVPDNRIDYWAKAILKWLETAPQKLSLLISLEEEIPKCVFWQKRADEEYLTSIRIIFLKVLCGLLQALDCSKPHDCKKTRLYKIVQECITSNRDFNIETNIQSLSSGNKYIYGFWVENQSFRRFFQNVDGEDTDEINMISEEWWRLLLTPENMPPAILREILLNDDLMDQIAFHKTVSAPLSGCPADFVLSSYGCFLKALIDFLEETYDAQFVPFKKRVPALCGMVVKNECVNLDDQKLYLERIFNNRNLSPDSKHLLLVNDIFVNLSDDAKRNPEQIIRVIPVANAISQYYLKQYDFDRALQPWFSFATQGNLFLRIILSFYKSPHKYALICLIAVLLTFLPYYFTNSLVTELAAWSANLLFLGGGLISVVIFTSLLFQFFTKKDINYIELLMPRLLGAIAVGLSILVLENTTWQTSLRLDWGNWALLIITTVMGALIYIFVEVHKSTRLLPVSVIASPISLGKTPKLVQFRQSKFIRLFMWKKDVGAKTKNVINPVIRSMHNSAKIFWIGFFDALALSMFVSLIFGSAMLPDHFSTLTMTSKQISDLTGLLQIRILNNSEFGFLGFGWTLGTSFLKFVYSPKIVLLWAGLSLFIGTFVQLLWQDQRITSS